MAKHHLKRLEKDVIGHMRTAIAAFDTDHSIVRVNMNAAHTLFADHLTEWPEDFYTLYNGMLEIYCAYTPMPIGHYRKISIEVGYTSHPVKRWVADKVQPPPPTAIELVARFDALLHVWNEGLIGNSSMFQIIYQTPIGKEVTLYPKSASEIEQQLKRLASRRIVSELRIATQGTRRCGGSEPFDATDAHSKFTWYYERSAVEMRL